MELVSDFPAQFWKKAGELCALTAGGIHEIKIDIRIYYVY